MKKLLLPLGVLAALLFATPSKADARVVLSFGLPGFGFAVAPLPPPVVYYRPRPFHGRPVYFRRPVRAWRGCGR